MPLRARPSGGLELLPHPCGEPPCASAAQQTSKYATPSAGCGVYVGQFLLTTSVTGGVRAHVDQPSPVDRDCSSKKWGALGKRTGRRLTRLRSLLRACRPYWTAPHFHDETRPRVGGRARRIDAYRVCRLSRLLTRRFGFSHGSVRSAGPPLTHRSALPTGHLATCQLSGSQAPAPSPAVRRGVISSSRTLGRFPPCGVPRRC